MNFRRELLALVLFGVAFGYVEAAVVVYLRVINEPMRHHLPAHTEDEVFPLTPYPDWVASGQQRVVVTELGREFATLVMLAAIGLAHGRNVRQWFAGFLISFGLWDIFYYVFLRVLIGWPASLWTWDFLFSLPVPWTGPVIAPVLVAGEMVAAGVLLLWRESRGTPIALRTGHWLALCGGGLIVVVAFCWDFQNVAAGGMPNPFPWPVFALGDLLGVAGFLHALPHTRAAG